MALSIKRKWLGVGLAGFAGAVSLSVNHIQRFEGYSPVVYKDPVGINTYCYGETHKPIPGKVYSKEYCSFILHEKASTYIRAVRGMVPDKVFLSPQELAAWGSFTYNAGLNAFAHSTALKLLKQGRRHAACRQLPRWVYADGKRLKGLENRRHTEEELCIQGASQGDI